MPEDIDPSLCTHLIYSFAKMEHNHLAAFEWNDESTAWSTGMCVSLLLLFFRAIFLAKLQLGWDKVWVVVGMVRVCLNTQLLRIIEYIPELHNYLLRLKV